MANSKRASSRVSQKRASKKRAPARAAKKAVARKKTAARKRAAGSPGGAKRNPGTTDKLTRVSRSLSSGRPLRAGPVGSTRATNSIKRKSAAAREERAAVVVLDGRRLSRRIAFTARLSEHIRQRYEEAGEGADVIARGIGVAKATVQRLVREQGWTRAAEGPRDLSRAAQLEAEARALAASTLPSRRGGAGRRALREQGEPGPGVCEPSAAPRASDAPSTPAPIPSAQAGGEEPAAPDEEPVDIGDAIERLLRAVSAEIGVYENLRAQLASEPQTQREAHKTTNNLASLTSTLDTLRRMRAGQTATVSHDEDDDDIPADIDAFREALARRIDAFVASRTDAGDAGPDDAEGAAQA